MPHRILLNRIRAEFLEMPGLRLTLAQAHRLCGGDRAACENALHALVDEHFLALRQGRYARPTDASMNGEVEHHRHQHVHRSSR